MGDSVFDYCGLGNIVKGVKKRKKNNRKGPTQHAPPQHQHAQAARPPSQPSQDFLRNNDSVHTILSRIDMLERKYDDVLGRGASCSGMPRTQCEGGRCSCEQAMEREKRENAASTGDPDGPVLVQFMKVLVEAMAQFKCNHSGISPDTIRQEPSGVTRATSTLKKRYVDRSTGRSTDDVTIGDRPRRTRSNLNPSKLGEGSYVPTWVVAPAEIPANSKNIARTTAMVHDVSAPKHSSNSSKSLPMSGKLGGVGHRSGSAPPRVPSKVPEEGCEGSVPTDFRSDSGFNEDMGNSRAGRGASDWSGSMMQTPSSSVPSMCQDGENLQPRRPVEYYSSGGFQKVQQPPLLSCQKEFSEFQRVTHGLERFLKELERKIAILPKTPKDEECIARVTKDFVGVAREFEDYLRDCQTNVICASPATSFLKLDPSEKSTCGSCETKCKNMLKEYQRIMTDYAQMARENQRISCQYQQLLSEFKNKTDDTDAEETHSTERNNNGGGRENRGSRANISRSNTPRRSLSPTRPKTPASEQTEQEHSHTCKHHKERSSRNDSNSVKKPHTHGKDQANTSSRSLRHSSSSSIESPRRATHTAPVEEAVLRCCSSHDDAPACPSVALPAQGALFISDGSSRTLVPGQNTHQQTGHLLKLTESVSMFLAAKYGFVAGQPPSKPVPRRPPGQLAEQRSSKKKKQEPFERKPGQVDIAVQYPAPPRPHQQQQQPQPQPQPQPQAYPCPQPYPCQQNVYNPQFPPAFPQSFPPPPLAYRPTPAPAPREQPKCNPKPDKSMGKSRPVDPNAINIEIVRPWTQQQKEQQQSQQRQQKQEQQQQQQQQPQSQLQQNNPLQQPFFPGSPPSPYSQPPYNPYNPYNTTGQFPGQCPTGPPGYPPPGYPPSGHYPPGYPPPGYQPTGNQQPGPNLPGASPNQPGEATVQESTKDLGQDLADRKPGQARKGKGKNKTGEDPIVIEIQTPKKNPQKPCTEPPNPPPDTPKPPVKDSPGTGQPGPPPWAPPQPSPYAMPPPYPMPPPYAMQPPYAMPPPYATPQPYAPPPSPCYHPTTSGGHTQCTSGCPHNHLDPDEQRREVCDKCYRYGIQADGTKKKNACDNKACAHDVNFPSKQRKDGRQDVPQEASHSPDPRSRCIEKPRAIHEERGTNTSPVPARVEQAEPEFKAEPYRPHVPLQPVKHCRRRKLKVKKEGDCDESWFYVIRKSASALKPVAQQHDDDEWEELEECDISRYENYGRQSESNYSYDDYVDASETYLEPSRHYELEHRKDPKPDHEHAHHDKNALSNEHGQRHVPPQNEQNQNAQDSDHSKDYEYNDDEEYYKDDEHYDDGEYHDDDEYYDYEDEGHHHDEKQQPHVQVMEIARPDSYMRLDEIAEQDERPTKLCQTDSKALLAYLTERLRNEEMWKMLSLPRVRPLSIKQPERTESPKNLAIRNLGSELSTRKRSQSATSNRYRSDLSISSKRVPTISSKERLRIHKLAKQNMLKKQAQAKEEAGKKMLEKKAKAKAKAEIRKTAAERLRLPSKTLPSLELDEDDLLNNKPSSNDQMDGIEESLKNLMMPFTKGALESRKSNCIVNTNDEVLEQSSESRISVQGYVVKRIIKFNSQRRTMSMLQTTSKNTAGETSQATTMESTTTGVLQTQGGALSECESTSSFISSARRNTWALPMMGSPPMICETSSTCLLSPLLSGSLHMDDSKFEPYVMDNVVSKALTKLFDSNDNEKKYGGLENLLFGFEAGTETVPSPNKSFPPQAADLNDGGGKEIQDVLMDALIESLVISLNQPETSSEIKQDFDQEAEQSGGKHKVIWSPRSLLMTSSDDDWLSPQSSSLKEAHVDWEDIEYISYEDTTRALRKIIWNFNSASSTDSRLRVEPSQFVMALRVDNDLSVNAYKDHHSGRLSASQPEPSHRSGKERHYSRHCFRDSLVRQNRRSGHSIGKSCRDGKHSRLRRNTPVDSRTLLKRRRPEHHKRSARPKNSYGCIVYNVGGSPFNNRNRSHLYVPGNLWHRLSERSFLTPSGSQTSHINTQKGESSGRYHHHRQQEHSEDESDESTNSRNTKIRRRDHKEHKDYGSVLRRCRHDTQEQGRYHPNQEGKRHDDSRESRYNHRKNVDTRFDRRSYGMHQLRKRRESSSATSSSASSSSSEGSLVISRADYRQRVSPEKRVSFAGPEDTNEGGNIAVDRAHSKDDTRAHHMGGSRAHNVERGRHTDDRARHAHNRAHHVVDRARHTDAGARHTDLGAHGADDEACHTDARARHTDLGAHRADNGARHTDAGARHVDDRVHHTDTGAHHVDARARHTDDRARHTDDRARHTDDRARHTDDRARHTDDRARHTDDRARHQKRGITSSPMRGEETFTHGQTSKPAPPPPLPQSEALDRRRDFSPLRVAESSTSEASVSLKPRTPRHRRRSRHSSERFRRGSRISRTPSPGVKLRRKVSKPRVLHRQKLIAPADSKSTESYEKVNVKDFIDFLATLSRNTIGTLSNKRKALRLYRDFLTHRNPRPK